MNLPSEPQFLQWWINKHSKISQDQKIRIIIPVYKMNYIRSIYWQKSGYITPFGKTLYHFYITPQQRKV